MVVPDWLWWVVVPLWRVEVPLWLCLVVVPLWRELTPLCEEDEDCLVVEEPEDLLPDCRLDCANKSGAVSMAKASDTAAPNVINFLIAQKI